MKPIILTLTGPSCAGKSTLEKALVKTGKFESVISTTTRKPRQGEVDGVNYHFVSLEQFKWGIQAGEFIEYVEFNGNMYGVTKHEAERIAASGKFVVVVVEPQGRDQIINYCRKLDWHIFNAYVTTDAKHIARRFLERAYKDIVTSHENDKDATLGIAADRLAVMLTEESEWGAEADAGGIYDFICEGNEVDDMNMNVGMLTGAMQGVNEVYASAA